MIRLVSKLNSFFKGRLTALRGWAVWGRPQQCQTCQVEERRRAWVAHHLATSGLTPIVSDSGTFDLLKKQVLSYQQIKETAAWKDYQFRLSQLREATRFAIERGGLDKYGQRHDDEQRACLYLLDNLLGYLPALQEQHDQIVASMLSDEAKAGTPLYGDDILMGATTDLY